MKHCSGCKLAISALLCAFLAAGCAARVGQVQQTTEVRFAGVVTMRAADAPTRRARMVWTRFLDGDGTSRDTADIKTPFGTTHARLEIDADGMQILVGGRPAQTANAAPDLQAWLNVLPPPHSIGYWLAGESDPAYSTREVFVPHEPGIGRITQHEWEVEYAERDKDGRPSRILMRPPTLQLPDAEAEVRITRWLTK